ncbi:hypothetical protein M3J09_009898 [Ascochyta lentis]
MRTALLVLYSRAGSTWWHVILMSYHHSVLISFWERRWSSVVSPPFDAPRDAGSSDMPQFVSKRDSFCHRHCILGVCVFVSPMLDLETKVTSQS